MDINVLAVFEYLQQKLNLTQTDFRNLGSMTQAAVPFRGTRSLLFKLQINQKHNR